MSSSISVFSCGDSKTNNSILDYTISVQSSIENNDSSSKETLFPLLIRDTYCHTQRVTNNVTLNFVTCINEFLKRKKCML